MSKLPSYLPTPIRTDANGVSPEVSRLTLHDNHQARDFLDITAAVDTFMMLFAPNPNKHGIMTRLYQDTNGDWQKNVVTNADQPVTRELVTAHLEGDARIVKHGLGYLAGTVDGTNVGCIDLDKKNYAGNDPATDPDTNDTLTLEDARQRVLDVCRALGLHVYSEESVRGGWHIWLFFTALLPYATVRKALREIVRRAGLASSTETYPEGEDHKSTWVAMPYYGAAKSKDGLGRTFLQTADGEAIRFNELEEWLELSDAGTIKALGDAYVEDVTASHESAATDLSPDGLDLLLDAIKTPDLKKLTDRHAALAAVVNVAARMGRKDEMVKALQDERVGIRAAWIQDGSRDERTWAAEVQRWAKADKSDRRRGIKFLLEMGFIIPDLPRTKNKTNSANHPRIIVNSRFLRDISADAMDAVNARNEPPFLFMRGTVPARVKGDKTEALTAVSLKGVLDRCADFVKVTFDKHGEEVITPARPPSDLAPDLLTSATLTFPPLEDVVYAPVFLPGGALLAEDGYNAPTGLLLKLKGLSSLRADMPVDEALALLYEVFGQFPFTEQAGWAHTLSMTLQAFVRPLIQGVTPMYLIDAPARGTGKGLLAEAAMLIPYGYAVPTMSQPNDSDELRKAITSVLLEARPMVFLDNVTRLGSVPLHAALTSEVWQDRILGRTETVTMPNRALWLASGNNVTLTDEMVRRVVPIRLDAGVERPEDRTGFKHAPLAEYVRAHRSELVSACLSLVQAWIDAGLPQGASTLGRYETWAGTMGGILEVCEVPGFLGGRERLHAEADGETKEWSALCAAWWSSYEVRPVTAKDLFDIIKTCLTS